MGTHINTASGTSPLHASRGHVKITKLCLDKSSIAGIVIALSGIAAAIMLEGGRAVQILQPTAALIVCGGTLGAVMVQFPLDVVFEAVRSLVTVVFETKHDARSLMEELARLSAKARRQGVVALDEDLDAIDNPFLQRSLCLAVDGTRPEMIREIMKLEMDTSAEREEEVPNVYESAGGFAPTIGIIGAVLGLIQVMQHLGNIAEVGRGIAVAFVATLYGVASANLFLLPAAGKLKTRLRKRQILREMALEGVICIAEDMNPRMIESRLLAFLREHSEKDRSDA